MDKEIVKLVVTGPVNAGKTTLIRHLSDTPVVTTDETATDNVADVKQQTTVAMDYGILKVDDDLELHLYGTPGQRRFEFMWDVLAVGATGIIFLADGADRDSIREMKYIYHYFRDLQHLPAIVAVTKQDLEGSASLEEVSSYLDAPDVPVLGCDPRDKEDSKTLALSLFELIGQEQLDEDFAEDSDFF